MREGAGGHAGRGKRWRAAYDPKFERQRPRHGKNTTGRVNGAAGDLLASENVRDPRDRKGRILVDGARTQVFAYRVDRSHRILYCVSDDCMRFLRAGDHKAAHGKGRPMRPAGLCCTASAGAASKRRRWRMVRRQQARPRGRPAAARTGSRAEMRRTWCAVASPGSGQGDGVARPCEHPRAPRGHAARNSTAGSRLSGKAG